ncbi:MFS transporter [Sphingomonas sp.]|uniref:MFS transporter n=1 Tax=Sphingomonas sp. TaxID=28214 RepID=UPI002DD6B711|nr:MFS transporter [Sphingomonas sp.]
MTNVTGAVDGAGQPASDRMTRSGIAWAALECGRFPYVYLISGTVFLPYFASVVIGDPVSGQAKVAMLGKIAGIAAALTAPILGASIDRIGPRKPLLAGGTIIMAILLSMLWWAKPGDTGLPVWTILAVLVAITVLYAYTEVLHNSMLVRASEGSGVSRLSAASFGLGYVASLVVLVGVLWAFALPGQHDSAWLPAQPLFGLDPEKHENIRIVGPIAGALVILALLPLLLFTRDHERSGIGLFAALRGGLAYLAQLPAHLRKHPNARTFIIACMFYRDGVVAMSLFIGVVAAGVMGWKLTELLILGIMLIIFSLFGSWIAVWLEERFESKRSVQIGLLMAVVFLTGLVGTSPTQIFFLGGDDPALLRPLWQGGVLDTAPQLAFLFFAAAADLSATIVATGSRALLVKITPPEETGAFFGLYSLVTTATAWLAPLAIGYATVATGSQRWGFAPVVGFFAIGFVLLSFVRQERR